jgi:hypothetical protein
MCPSKAGRHRKRPSLRDHRWRRVIMDDANKVGLPRTIRLILPVGQISKSLSSPIRKNIPIHF